MRDRRFEPRFPAAESVELSWSESPGVDGAARGTLADLSRSGARIQLARTIPVNTTVRLTMNGTEVRGQVRSCVKNSTLYLVGVEFDVEFQGVLKRKP